MCMLTKSMLLVAAREDLILSSVLFSLNLPLTHKHTNSQLRYSLIVIMHVYTYHTYIFIIKIKLLLNLLFIFRIRGIRYNEGLANPGSNSD